MQKMIPVIALCLSMAATGWAAAVKECYVPSYICPNLPPPMVIVGFQPEDLLGEPLGPPVNVPVRCSVNPDKKAVNTKLPKVEKGYYAGPGKCGYWTAMRAVGLHVKLGDKIGGDCGDSERGAVCPKPPPDKP